MISNRKTTRTEYDGSCIKSIEIFLDEEKTYCAVGGEENILIIDYESGKINERIKRKIHGRALFMKNCQSLKCLVCSEDRNIFLIHYEKKEFIVEENVCQDIGSGLGTIFLCGEIMGGVHHMGRILHNGLKLYDINKRTETKKKIKDNLLPKDFIEKVHCDHGLNPFSIYVQTKYTLYAYNVKSGNLYSKAPKFKDSIRGSVVFNYQRKDSLVISECLQSSECNWSSYIVQFTIINFTKEVADVGLGHKIMSRSGKYYPFFVFGSTTVLGRDPFRISSNWNGEWNLGFSYDNRWSQGPVQPVCVVKESGKRIYVAFRRDERLEISEFLNVTLENIVGEDMLERTRFLKEEIVERGQDFEEMNVQVLCVSVGNSDKLFVPRLFLVV